MISVIESYSDGSYRSGVFMHGKTGAMDFYDTIAYCEDRLSGCTWLVVDDDQGWLRAGGEHGAEVNRVIRALDDEHGINHDALLCLMDYVEAVAGYFIREEIANHLRATEGRFYLPSPQLRRAILSNINWDTEGADVDLPEKDIIYFEHECDYDDEQQAVNALTDKYGWCVLGCDIEID